MKMHLVSGGSIALAAVALALGGVAVTSDAHAAKSVMCAGINSCKGMGACKSSMNACKGMNSCKGMGWLPVKSKSACLKKGGKVIT